jgi:glycine oxidase
MPRADVLVLGGGLVGLACARELAKRGVAVEVLEARAPGAGASSAGAGLLAPISDWDSVRPVVELCQRSRDGWRAWLGEVELESGTSVEYDASGGFLVALDDAEIETLAAEIAIADAAGEAIHEVPVAAVRGAVPDLSPAARRALHLPGEHRVDNVRAVEALAEACRRAGAAITSGFAARRVVADARGVRVVGADAVREAARLVVAAGAWSGAIEGLPELAVRPVRGQMLRLEGVAWPWNGSVRGPHDYVVRRGASSLLVGATVEEAGFAEQPTLEGLGGLLAFVRRLFPGLGDPPVSAIWAGLRPGSPDGLPLVGPLGPADGPLWAACGHYRNGILLAPWTGAAIAQWIVDGRPRESVRAFAPGRFA